MKKYKKIVLMGLILGGSLGLSASSETDCVRYDGKVSVLIQNQTGMPLVLSGFPFNEFSCTASFQFDDYDFLTTSEFYKSMPARSQTQANVLYTECFDPEAFQANYGIQLASQDKDMGYLSVGCFFDQGGCEAQVKCPEETVGFRCEWTGGATEYKFTLLPVGS